MFDLQCLQEEEEKCLHCGEALVYNRGIFMGRCYFLIQNKSKQTLICSTVIFVLIYLGRFFLFFTNYTGHKCFIKKTVNTIFILF